MVMPISDLYVMLPLGFVLDEAALAIQLGQPSCYEAGRVVVVGEK
jgi:hypothetical protein